MVQRIRGSGAARRVLALGAVVVALGGCDSLLEVENPNNVKQDDLDNPTAAPAIANGAFAVTAQATSWMVLDHSSTTDELRWVGSRDGYAQLNNGNDIANPNNEFIDAAFPIVAEARFAADDAIARLEKFNTEGTLANRTHLARAYLYGAIMYTSIATNYDDFVLSNRRTPQPNIGEANMSRLYDTAIGYLDKALPIAEAANNADLVSQILAMRTRAKYEKAVWAKVNPRGTIAADPLVNSAAAEADGALFLARTSNSAWRYRFAYSATTVTNNWGAWVNERLELRPGDPYITPTADNKKVASVKMTDLINTTTVAPQLQRDITEMVATRQFGQITVLSWREVRLIMAEIALAKGNLTDFATHINAIRALDNLTPWSSTNTAHPSGRAMLEHMRRTNLFMQGKRLPDHYRFKVPSVHWIANSEAVRTPGTFFPIARIELDANPLVKR